MTRAEAENLRRVIETAAQSLDDPTALRAVCLHPAWTAGMAYEAGFKVQRGGKLWRALQGHTSQSGWEPENAPSLWARINETHTGDLSDPIPYDGNMALENGRHYIQNGVIYRCVRDTEIPVYASLAELVGLYVEAV